MIQKLDLNENLINKINYSLSFSLNNEILSVERVSYEPLWRNSFMSFFVSKKIQLENRKPILTLEIYDSMVGGILEGKIRIPRKRKLLPWDIHIFLFQKITEIAF